MTWRPLVGVLTSQVRKEIAAFLALFPPELITEAEELYRAVYVSS